VKLNILGALFEKYSHLEIYHFINLIFICNFKTEMSFEDKERKLKEKEAVMQQEYDKKCD